MKKLHTPIAALVKSVAKAGAGLMSLLGYYQPKVPGKLAK